MHRSAIKLCLLTAAAAALRLIGLGREPFWLDEAWSLQFARWDLTGSLFAEISHPPLWRLLLHFWIRVAGESEFAVRLPAAVLGTACVPLAFSVARRLVGRRTAWWTAALVATSPFLVYFSQEARNYSLFLFLTLLSTRLLLPLTDGLRAPRVSRGAAYAATALLGLFTHYFFFFVLAAHALHAFARGPAAHRAFLLAGGAAALLFSPWAVWVALHWESQARAWMYPVLTMTFEALQRMAGGYGLKVHHLRPPPGAFENSLAALYLPAAILAAAALAGLRRAVRAGAGPLLAGTLLLPPAALLLLSLMGGPRLAADRTYVFAAAFLYLLAAAGAARGRIGALLGILTLLVFGAGHLAWHCGPRTGKEPWDQVAHWLEERSDDGDVILVHKPYLTTALRPYLETAATVVPLGDPDPAALERPALGRARRVFLVLAHSSWDTAERWVEILDARLTRVEDHLFPKLWGIRVYAFKAGG